MKYRDSNGRFTKKPMMEPVEPGSAVALMCHQFVTHRTPPGRKPNYPLSITPTFEDFSMTRPTATTNGFKFGAMTVEATTAIERNPGQGEHTVIRIVTEAGVELSVYCSPTGRSLRVFRKGKGELRLP